MLLTVCCFHRAIRNQAAPTPLTVGPPRPVEVVGVRVGVVVVVAVAV